jgi:putative ABC transport system permease protein
VGDVRHATLADPPMPRAYDLFGEHWGRTMYVVARVAQEPYSIVPAFRAAIQRLDPGAPVFEVQSVGDLAAAAIRPRRLATGFAAAISLVTLLLASIGLYGLVSSSVAARTKELGVRQALGASRRDIVRLILTEALWLSGAGIIAGGFAARLTMGIVESQLFGVAASDPRVLGAVAASVAAIGTLAAYLPARRAARIQPTIALRHE